MSREYKEETAVVAGPGRGQLANVKSSSPMDESLEKLWHKVNHALEMTQVLRGRLDKVLSDPTPENTQDESKDVEPEQRKTYVVAVENIEDQVNATILILNEIMDRLLV